MRIEKITEVQRAKEKEMELRTNLLKFANKKELELLPTINFKGGMKK